MTDVIAHRGLHGGVHGDRRENTVPAFLGAVAAGVAGIELDARRTGDGAVVVHHDPRLPDGRAIVDCLRADLPAWLPDLSDALDACRSDRPGFFVNIEIKNEPDEPDFDDTEAVVEAVLAHLDDRPEAPSTWLISSFHRPTIDRCRRLAPQIATAWLTAAAVDDAVVADLAGAGHAAVHPWDPTVDDTTIARCHAAGLRINTWTCNDVARATELAGWGVDGICTDRPVDVLAAL